MRTSLVTFGLFLFCLPLLGIAGLCYYYGMTQSLDSNGNPVSCQPDFEGQDTYYSDVNTAKMKVPCGAPGSDSKCTPYTHWQTNIDNVCISMLILTCMLAFTLLCLGLCNKIKFEEASVGFGLLLISIISAIVVVLWVMGFLAGYMGNICRGRYLDDFEDSGIENYQPINAWSLEQIKFLDGGEVVPGYNKTMSVLMRYIAYYQLVAYSMMALFGLGEALK